MQKLEQLPPYSLLPRLNLTASFSLLYPFFPQSEQCRRMRSRGCSWHHLCLSFLHTLFLCSSAGALPWQSFKNFSNRSPSHKLQFFKNCFSMGPLHAVWSTRNRPIQCGLPRAAVPTRKSAPVEDLVHSLQFPLGQIHVFWHGVLHRQHCGYSPEVLHGLQGDNLIHHDYRGISALVPGAHLPPSFTLVSAKLLLRYFSLLLTLLCSILLFLNTFSLRCHHLGCALQWGYSSNLKLVAIWHRAGSGLYSYSPTLPPPHLQY